MKTLSEEAKQAIDRAFVASRVTRWHTHTALPPQTNAEHSWGVVMILLLAHPDPSLNLIKAAMFHDLGEQAVGDLPSPGKAKMPPELREHLREAEKAHITEFIGIDIPELTEEERLWLTMADHLEASLHSAFEASRAGRIANAIDAAYRSALMMDEKISALSGAKEGE